MASPKELVEAAALRVLNPGSSGFGETNWVFMQMGAAERKAFDNWLVSIKDPLAYEPGTTEQRFKQKVRELVEETKR
jgi:hypothetical protein